METFGKMVRVMGFALTAFIIGCIVFVWQSTGPIKEVVQFCETFNTGDAFTYDDFVSRVREAHIKIGKVPENAETLSESAAASERAERPDLAPPVPITGKFSAMLPNVGSGGTYCNLEVASGKLTSVTHHSFD